MIENVGLNPTRDGIFRVLEQMGAAIDYLDRREVGGEPVADLRIRHAPLNGIEVDPGIAPSMIDEFPVLFVAAALAKDHGHARTRGIARQGKRPSGGHGQRPACRGARVEENEDGLTIERFGWHRWRVAASSPPISTIASP